DVAESVYGAEFRAAAGGGTRIATLIQDEIFHPAMEGIADPDSLLETRIVHVVGFRVEHIDQVFVVNRKCYSAGHSELVPGRQVLPFLIEDLNTGIGSIAYEQPPSFVHGDAMRGAELARRVSGLPPCLDKLSVLRVFDDAVIRAVAVGNKNIAVGRGDDA